MSNINLLPWREEAKKRKQREFFVLLAGAGFVAVLLVMGVNLVIGMMRDEQEQRNNFLRNEIAVLDAQLVEIQDIKKRRAQIEERIALIQQLQESRNQATELFNDLPKLTPTGIYLTTLSFKNDRIDVKGLSEDNTRLVTLLRNINSSVWLGGTPKPSITSAEGGLSNFSFSFIVDPEKNKQGKTEKDAGGKQ